MNLFSHFMIAFSFPVHATIWEKKYMAVMFIFIECRSKRESNVISYTEARMI